MFKKTIEYGKIRKLNFNKKRHELLKLLSRNRIGTEVKEKDFSQNNVIAIPFEQILSELKINEHERFVISSVLFDNDEVMYFNNGFEGLLAKRKGVSAYYTDKYLEIDSVKRKENTKFYFNIIATLISLSIAFMSVILLIRKDITDSKDKQEQVHEIETKIQSLETDIEILKANQIKTEKTK